MEKYTYSNPQKFSTFNEIGKIVLRDIASFSSENQEYIITGDRKGSIYIFYRKEGYNLILFRKFQGHTLGISSFCSIRSWKGEQIIISGGLDKKANFWKIDDLLNLKHEIAPSLTIDFGDNICLIKETAKGEISFISWDNTTTIIYEDGRKNLIINNGDLPSWDIIKIDQFYISADASKSISIFNSDDGKFISKINNVDSCALRGIFQYNGKVYVTSNQGMIFEFSYNEGKLEKEREYQISDEPLYKYIVNANRLYIGGEDKVVFVVDLDLFQTIDAIPVIGSVWGCNIGCITNDLCISTDKGNVFVFTTNQSRIANEEEIHNYLHKLESTSINNQALEMYDVEEFPKEIDEKDFQPGRFFAIQENGMIRIYIYSFCFDKYVCIGHIERKEVQKKFGPDGKQYDTSITIIGEDESSHELFLNYDDDPDELARRFCQENNLEDRFIQQISDFISKSFSNEFKKIKKIKNNSSGSFDDLISYGVAEMQGRRPYMEDFNTIFKLSNGKIVFCVFDGHGGDGAVKYAIEHIQEALEKNIQSETFISDALKELNAYMVDNFQECGSTAVVACYSPQEHTLSVSNLGDSRGIVCKENPIQITFDHKASDPSEIEYIEQHGGSIVNGRISGILNISRFLGDGILSKCINHEPYSSVTKVEKGDRILIGCDGIFDFLSNEQCSEIVRASETVENAVISVRDKSYNDGSADNLTVIVFEILK